MEETKLLEEQATAPVETPVEEVKEKKTTRKKDKVMESLEEAKELAQSVSKSVQEKQAEPVDTRPFAMINNKKYYIDSDNSDLLEDVAGGKTKDEKGNWVDQTFKYLPARHIYALLDALFLCYNFKSEPVKFLEEYKVNKKVWDKSNKKWVDEEQTVRVYEKQITIETTVQVGEYERIIRETTGYAQGLAPLSILTSDSARNGFMNKLAMRARKEALKNLGKVFRTYDNEDDNEFIPEETVSVGGKSIADVVNATSKVEEIKEQKVQKSAEYESIQTRMTVIKDFWAEKPDFTQKELVDTMGAVKTDLRIVANTPLMDSFKEIYEELKVKAKDYKAPKKE